MRVATFVKCFDWKIFDCLDSGERSPLVARVRKVFAEWACERPCVCPRPCVFVWLEFGAVLTMTRLERLHCVGLHALIQKRREYAITQLVPFAIAASGVVVACLIQPMRPQAQPQLQ